MELPMQVRIDLMEAGLSSRHVAHTKATPVRELNRLIHGSVISLSILVLVGRFLVRSASADAHVAGEPSPMCHSSMSADLDDDGDVDLDDLATFGACLTGPAMPYGAESLPPDCPLIADFEGVIRADFNRDGDVDHSDFACLQGEYTGPRSCEGTPTSCGEATCIDCNALPNVSAASCRGTSCVIDQCDPGFAECDGSVGNGCERLLGGHSNSSPGENLGAYSGDNNDGFPICAAQSCALVQTRIGTNGRWFHMRALEASDCCAYVAATFELVVPEGVDFDLHVSQACRCVRWDHVASNWVDGCSGTNGPGQTEHIVAWCDDDCGGADDSFDAIVEVRYAGGLTCEEWRLNVSRRDCY